ncbi:S9 family peptidase [Microbacterium sp. EST19A]|uniref:alpha/beta hydrolase family protein n=1 Tax=Microbacterium sp. EST19A TaxID=2862681 RepID=UPI001CBD9227|nr:alpha/beta fold hydrolase [Microbacterium sp. EST19A]
MNAHLPDPFHHAPTGIRPFNDNPDYDYEIRGVLGQSVYGAGEPGEVLAATAGIKKNDHDGWYKAWFDLADRTFATAQKAAAGTHRVSAASAFLRASAYYGVAVNAVSALESTDDLAPTFTKQQDAWNGFIAHTSASVEEVSIPYEASSLPGWFFRPSVAEGAPTLIAVNGSDGSLAALWASCVAPALERGYNVLVFDGPGQQSELFERNVPFRPDWEHVLTPVFDFVARLDGVDAMSISVYGISQGGYWVARALAFEHRFAAAITDPGVVDVSTSWTGHLPKSLLKLLDAGETAKFDKEMELGMKFSPETARTWRFRARPYGTTGYGETIEAVRKYTVADVAGQIVTPLAILAPEGEQFWPGQSDQLASLTPNVSTVIRFTAAEGAGEHCQPLARTLTAERMLDWLDDRLGR